MNSSQTAVPPFGSLAWAQANGGRMSARERVLEGGRSTRAVLGLMGARAAQRVGVPARKAVSIDIESLVFPDSRIAREAEEECRTTVSPMLYNHSVRTYIFGLMLAQRDGLKPDHEMFYVASMLHDLTLGETHRHFAPIDCFAARGGLLAEEWTSVRGWDPSRRATVSNAITMHLNSRVDPSFGPEAQMLRAGAGVDTIGLRYRHLAPASMEQILERYPRHGLKVSRELAFVDEGHPGTRAQFLRQLGFAKLLRTSQFAE
ncbi:hypothetical protein [Nocardioides sp.]|uniref:hypothetical protein n=1 Tax=Nocardioides sp. TaxID=35761 RepID=UPI00356808A4